MNVQTGIKISASALFVLLVVFAPARAAMQQTPSRDTPTQQTPTYDTPHQQTPTYDTPHQQTPTYDTPHQQTPTYDTPHQQTPTYDTPHQQTPTYDTPTQVTPSTPSNDAHEAQEELERAAKDAANSIHEAEEERQRAIAKAAHEAQEELGRIAKAADEALEHQPAMEVTMVGCVIREREYRKVHHSGKGGPLGTGIGGGNEYILVSATRIPSNSPVRIGERCDPTVGGDAYELTGKGESSMLRPYLGHWVELTGKLKKAKITKATRGTANPQPTGGGGPWWQDLKIFEINVYAVKDYVPPVVAMMPPKIEEQAAVIETPQPEVAETPEPVATAGREVLPKTASSLPLVGLLGALFVAAAIGLRVVRGMTGRADL